MNKIIDIKPLNRLRILLNSLYFKISRPIKRWIFKLIDLIIILVSVYLAFCLRFDIFDVWDLLPQYKIYFYVLFPVKILLFWIVGMYRPVIRYAGSEFFGTALKGVLGGTLIFIFISFFVILPQFPDGPQFPRSIIIIDAFLTLMLVIGARITVRWFLVVSLKIEDSKIKTENIIIYGAGRLGSQLVQTLSRENSYNITCFVDDNPNIQKHQISGKNVYSPHRLEKLIKKYKVDTIILTISSAGQKRIAEVIRLIRHHNVQIKKVPDITQILSGEISVNEIRNIDINDLLGREEVAPDPALLKADIENKTVMVTGAGGSIGSELCRQILNQNPRKLILFERNEYALYSIESELQNANSVSDIEACLGSVTISERVEEVLTKHCVNTIYHAAAYKHVPLVEANMTEGIFNNINGTLRCVKAAEKCSVSTFVLISTDKAVRPTNVMGTTKRIAELILQAFAKIPKQKTRFVMVRFGNVLDSAGSVVPRFRQQIEEGKNLTVTHPEINRFFMSIPEAARLVIQAGALGKGGDVFLLEMGESVRIYDLAVHMIELSGLSLGKDIDIEFTGLRPGEKLYEELLIDTKNESKTKHPKIFSAKEKAYGWEILSQHLDDLFSVIKLGDELKIIKQLQLIVPEYQPNHLNNDCPIENENMPKTPAKGTPVISYSQK